MPPKPAVFMLVSALGFSLMSLFVKLSAAQGIPVMQVLAARAFISLILSVVTLKAIGVAVFGRNHSLLFARGLIGFLALSMVYYSITHLPLAVATILQFLNPIFTALLGFVVLREPIGRALILCTLVSLVGVVVVVVPGSGFIELDLLHQTELLPPFALLMGLGGAIMSAVAYIIVRRLSPHEHPLVIVFYFPLVALPAAVPFLWQNFVWPSNIGWLYLLLVGGFTQIGQVYLTKAMALENAGKNMAYAYSQVLFATCLGIVFLDEIPTLWTLLGASCILFGAYLNIAKKGRSE